MKLSEAQKLYPEEWIAFRTVEEGDDPEGEVVLHSKNRRTFDRQLVERNLIDTYITFAGLPIPEGYAALFGAA